MTESLRIHPLSAAHTPGKEAEAALTAADDDVDEAAVEDHDPRVAGIRGVGSRRPVDGRLHVAKGMAGREPRATGVGWVMVHQARQLLQRRKAPAFALTDVQYVAVKLSILPTEGRRARRLLPDEPDFIVPHRRPAHHTGEAAGIARARSTGIVRRQDLVPGRRQPAVIPEIVNFSLQLVVLRGLRRVVGGHLSRKTIVLAGLGGIVRSLR